MANIAILKYDNGLYLGMKTNWRQRIIVDPKIMIGKPIVKGTRLRVDFILELLAQGWTKEDILKNYPQLSTHDLQAVLAYSVHTLKLETVYPL